MCESGFGCVWLGVCVMGSRLVVWVCVSGSGSVCLGLGLCGWVWVSGAGSGRRGRGTSDGVYASGAAAARAPGRRLCRVGVHF